MGKTRDLSCRTLVERYVKRAARLSPLRVQEVRGSTREEPARRSAETMSALRDVVRGGEAVVLTERGELMSSRQLAVYIGSRLDRAQTATCFLLGGEDGFLPQDESWAARRLSLSPMTLPHELARVLLAEQVYRALTLLRNVSYHK